MNKLTYENNHLQQDLLEAKKTVKIDNIKEIKALDESNKFEKELQKEKEAAKQ